MDRTRFSPEAYNLTWVISATDKMHVISHLQIAEAELPHEKNKIAEMVMVAQRHEDAAILLIVKVLHNTQGLCAT